MQRIGKTNILATVVIKTLRLYQMTHVFRRPTCRFYPSCSHYMEQAVHLHGLAKGLTLGILRLFKCHPLHAGGVDEVPHRLRSY